MGRGADNDTRTGPRRTGTRNIEQTDEAWSVLQRCFSEPVRVWFRKPRDIIRRCSQEFPDVQEIYRLNHNIVERLRRNRERLRYVPGNDE